MPGLPTLLLLLILSYPALRRWMKARLQELAPQRMNATLGLFLWLLLLLLHLFSRDVHGGGGGGSAHDGDDALQ